MSLLSTHQLCIDIGKRNICNNTNLVINAGEIWGILGPNGVGKTTLLHALAGLHPATSGTIQLQQHNLSSLSAKSIARQISILFQTINDTFPQTVLEYVTTSRFPHLDYFATAGKDDMRIIHAALAAMDIGTYQHRLIKHLSGGEKRRVAIAAVLAQTPLLYLLDEPINHLDMYHQLRTLKHFQHLVNTTKTSVVMSLHDVNLAQSFCTHVLLMFSDGSMQSGEVCDILSEENLSRLYDVRVRAAPCGNSHIWHYI